MRHAGREGAEGLTVLHARIDAVLYSISNNAEYGEYVTGQKVINEESRYAMRECLANIQNGSYAKRFILEGQANYPEMTAWRRNNAAHQIEVVGGQLRAMMPWIAKNKLVDQSKN